MAKVIMIQGTMSNAGKSLIAAGLCRVFRQDGYRVAPFKSQNMALNSFITKDGLEMGRAQVMQAEAAGIEPDVCMNPILLKPTSHVGSQVIVNGEVLGNMKARDYFKYKKQLIPDVLAAFEKLESMADIIVIEGAGSPAEINLKSDDIVNMGLAELVDAPVLLVGDIDRGGVFAQLLGTLMLLEEKELARVGGLVINKFRGDKSILDPGVVMLEERGGIPVTGVIPYVELALEDEDSLTERFDRKEQAAIRLVVVRYPRISNFTDFNIFEQFSQVSVVYATTPAQLEGADLILLPGSKNTMGDLKWLRESGMEAKIRQMSGRTPVFGICGGYQMLGASIEDPDGVEEGGSMRAMELLPIRTRLRGAKTRKQVTGEIPQIGGIFGEVSGSAYEGYEIHMGETESLSGSSLPAVIQENNIYGTYIHGIFDRVQIAETMIRCLAQKKGILLDDGELLDYRQLKEREYDRLADAIREHMDMKAVYSMLREAKLKWPEIRDAATQPEIGDGATRKQQEIKVEVTSGQSETVDEENTSQQEIKIEVTSGQSETVDEENTSQQEIKVEVTASQSETGDDAKESTGANMDEPSNLSTMNRRHIRIEQLLAGEIPLTEPDPEICRQFHLGWDRAAKPLDSLGAFETMTARMGAILGTTSPDLRKRAILTLCADNGVVAEGISQSGQEVTLAVMEAMGRKASSVGKMAAVCGCDTIPVDIGVNTQKQVDGVLARKVRMGTRNFAAEPAMTREETLQAIQTGMDLVGECKETGYQILGTGEMGIGNTTTSTAVACSLLGKRAIELTGRGAGLSDKGLQKKVQVIQKAIDRYQLYDADPLTVLSTVGGLDLAGLCGVMIGGACYHMPIVLDGVITAVAALTACRLLPRVRDYLFPSHQSREGAAAAVFAELGMEPVIRADLALGEGTGASMLFSLIDQAMALYEKPTTFADIRVEAYQRFESEESNVGRDTQAVDA